MIKYALKKKEETIFPLKHNIREPRQCHDRVSDPLVATRPPSQQDFSLVAPTPASWHSDRSGFNTRQALPPARGPPVGPTRGSPSFFLRYYKNSHYLWVGPECQVFFNLLFDPTLICSTDEKTEAQRDEIRAAFGKQVGPALLLSSLPPPHLHLSLARSLSSIFPASALFEGGARVLSCSLMCFKKLARCRHCDKSSLNISWMKDHHKA